MAQGKQQLKFESNPPIGYRDITPRKDKVPYYTLYWHRQAELKMTLQNVYK